MENAALRFPQRKIKKSYRSTIGHFPSVKNGRSVAFELALEKSLFLTLEFDDSVASYMEQPQFQIQENHKPRTYSADCYVKRTEASKELDTIIEAKYTTELGKHRQKLESKFKAATIAAEEMGMTFHLFTEQSHSPTYIKNLDFLYRYQTQSVDHDDDNRIIEHVDQPMSAFELADTLANSKQEYFHLANAVWSLVARGRLHADLEKEPLNMHSTIWSDHGSH